MTWTSKAKSKWRCSNTTTKLDHARFEYINVRQTPPDVVKDKSGGSWREDECYSTDDFYPSEYELTGIWRETQHVARDLLACLASDDPYVWYRIDLKGTSPHTCGQCFVKDLCKDEAMFGASQPTHRAVCQAARVRRHEDRRYVVLAEKPREFALHGVTAMSNSRPIAFVTDVVKKPACSAAFAARRGSESTLPEHPRVWAPHGRRLPIPRT